MTNCVNQKSRLLDFIQEITLSTKAGYFTIEVSSISTLPILRIINFNII